MNLRIKNFARANINHLLIETEETLKKIANEYKITHNELLLDTIFFLNNKISSLKKQMRVISRTDD
jgi:hypothetical protein